MPAYWPWIQVLRGLISYADRTNVAKWLSAGASEVVQIVPELHDVLPELPVPRQTSLSEPEQARFRLLISAVTFLRRAAEAQPLVIVLDDLHVADPTSFDDADGPCKGPTRRTLDVDRDISRKRNAELE